MAMPSARSPKKHKKLPHFNLLALLDLSDQAMNQLGIKLGNQLLPSSPWPAMEKMVPLSEQSKHYPAKNTCVWLGDMFKVKTSMAKVRKVHYSIILDFIRFHQISSDFHQISYSLMLMMKHDEPWLNMMRYTKRYEWMVWKNLRVQLSMAFPVFWSSVSAARCFAVSLRLSRRCQCFYPGKKPFPLLL